MAQSVKPYHQNGFILYLATHIASGREYVGRTCLSLSTRTSIHFRRAKSDAVPTPFHKALLEFGREAFTFEELARFTSHEELCNAEAAEIDARRPYYNHRKGSDGTRPRPRQMERRTEPVPDLEGEIWVAVAGFEGRYEVSNLGRVKSLDRYRPKARAKHEFQIVRGKLLSPAHDCDGYPIVSLCGGSRAVHLRRSVHSLVAAAFLGPRPNGLHVLHRNDDKEDNSATNLYYGTNADNGKDRAKNGKSSKGEERHNATLKAEDVRIIRELRPYMTLHALGKMFGTSHGNISAIVSRRAWKHVE